MARTLANVVDVPFSINDATSFTQVLHFAIEDTLIAKPTFRPAVSEKKPSPASRPKRTGRCGGRCRHVRAAAATGG